MSYRMCQARMCPNVLPADAASNRKYCSQTCMKRENQRRLRMRKAGLDPADDAEAAAARDKPVFGKPEQGKRDSGRRGPRYRQFVQAGYPILLVKKEITPSQVAKEMGTKGPNVSRWMKAWMVDNAGIVGEERIVAQERARAEVRDREITDFTRRYFPDLLAPGFHEEWAGLIEETVDVGGRTLLLAPQRHGKSEFMIRYCVKSIVADPNIKILWVSKTADLATKMVGYVRALLEYHEDLICDTFGRGAGSFVPDQRSGKPWTNSEFTVANRDMTRGKSPTMTALGVGGTILGRDADLIIIDDPQDRTRCLSPSQRQKDIEWFFTDFLSRKEEHTGVVYISSRQHEDDLAGNIISDHAEDWKIVVYRAHDPGCTIPEKDVERHTDCVLWPERRSFRWLMGQKRANREHFERNYMNNPQSDMMTYVSADDIADRKSMEHVAGAHPGGKLVAGIDPASAKPTAATLWAWRDGRRYLVDAIEAAPGNAGVRQIVSDWTRTYGCRRYIVEQNGYQGQIMQDAQVREMCLSLGVTLRGTYTSRVNKWDDAAGVVGMLHRIANPEGGIVLPGRGDPEVLDRLEQVYRQWLTFDPETANHKHAADDLVMASWFPHLEMDRYDRNDAGKVAYLEDRTAYGSTTFSSMYARA